MPIPLSEVSSARRCDSESNSSAFLRTARPLAALDAGAGACLVKTAVLLQLYRLIQVREVGRYSTDRGVLSPRVPVVGEAGLEPWNPMGHIYYGPMQRSCYSWCQLLAEVPRLYPGKRARKKAADNDARR